MSQAERVTVQAVDLDADERAWLKERLQEYRNCSPTSKAFQAYIRRRNCDRHDPRIIELENRRKVA